jgi:sporulation protein YlmC with PRC-barrel domain
MVMEQNGNRVVHTDPSTSYRRVMSASSLIKNYVYNRLNQEIGSLKEIMLDVPSGRVAYAVLAVGGFLGLGERLYAIPWGSLTLDEDRQCFIMDVQKERLEQAPTLDPDHWPDMSDPSWSTRIDSYWQNPSEAAEISGHQAEHGIEAARRYDRETAGFSDHAVEAKAQEAREALDGPEGESLRQAERMGKQRSQTDKL